ncbi:hypothetical protein V1522DRAFT_357188 [Lipomyces starkeyi]
MEEGHYSSHRATNDPILSRVRNFNISQAADLVIFGNQSIDEDSYKTGQMLEKLLNWCQATNASNVVVDDDSDVVTVARDLDGGTETSHSTDIRLNIPRFSHGRIL